MNELKNMTKTEHLQDTIRCMSNVMNDIALELKIPPDKYGEPDEIFDAIEALQSRLKIAEETLQYASHSAMPSDNSVLFYISDTALDKINEFLVPVNQRRL